jgi:hypothetical protein
MAIFLYVSVEFPGREGNILRIKQAFAFGLLFPPAWVGQARLALDKAGSSQRAKRFSGAHKKSRPATQGAGRVHITI